MTKDTKKIKLRVIDYLFILSLLWVFQYIPSATYRNIDGRMRRKSPNLHLNRSQRRKIRKNRDKVLKDAYRDHNKGIR